MPFITDEDGIERWVFTQPDDCDRLGRLGSLWRCEDCGWIWPLKDAPYQSAECDACGGIMEKAT